MNPKTQTVREAASHAARCKEDDCKVRHFLDAVIVEQVLHALGRPPELHAVQVRHLWLDRLRVNVLVGADASCVRVGHSYFLAVSEDGNLITSDPKIVRMY
jgi:hypothetical protein